MTSVASELSVLATRAAPQARPAAPKTDQADGDFASLIESQSEPRENPKAAKPDRARSARTEADDTPTEANVALQSRDGTGDPEKPAATDGIDAAAMPSAEDGQTAQLAAAAIPAIEETNIEETNIDETNIDETNNVLTDAAILAPTIPAVAADQAAVILPALPAIPVAATPIKTVPITGGVLPSVTDKAEPAAMATSDPAAMGPFSPATPAETVVADQPHAAKAANATPVAPALELAARQTPQLKPQAAPNSKERPQGDDGAVADTVPETAPPETLHVKPVKQAATDAPPAPRDAASGNPEPKADAAFKPNDLLTTQKPSSDTMPQLTTPAHAPMASAATTTLQAAPVGGAQPIPVNAIAVEIAGQAKAGNSRFEIRLDPPELGRIDVRLDVDRDGNVTSRLVIERADTYDLLRRDQSTLERALQQAGLKTSDNALEFQLRDQGFSQRQQAHDMPRRVQAIVQEAEVMPGEAASGYARLLGGRAGIDIRV